MIGGAQQSMLGCARWAAVGLGGCFEQPVEATNSKSKRTEGVEVLVRSLHGPSCSRQTVISSRRSQ